MFLVSGLFQGNGHEEVVACAWDGQTYIIDHNRTVVRFQVDENIRAFCAGDPRPHGPLLTTLKLDRRVRYAREVFAPHFPFCRIP